MSDPTGTNLTDTEVRLIDGSDPVRRQYRIAERLQALRVEADAGGGSSSELAGSGGVAARRLVSVNASGAFVQAGVDATNVVGINSENTTVEAGDPLLVQYGGRAIGIAVDDVDEGTDLKSCYGGRVGQMVTSTLAGTTIDTWSAGGNFGNQPANDGVEAVSDDNTDEMDLTVWYTRTGQGDTLYSETIALTGTTPAALTDTDIALVLGAELSDNGAGTVTIREASGDATITTIDSTAATQAGVVDVPDADQRAFGVEPTAVAGGASTKQIGFVGTDPDDGTEQLDSQALNGTNAVTANARFLRVTKLLVGDVATGTTGTVAVGAEESRLRRVGRSVGAATALGDELIFNLQV